MNQVQQALTELHCSLMDDASPRSVGEAERVIEWFRRAGVLTDDQARLWTLALGRCPERGDHVGGRAWCAYCGHIREASSAGEGQ